MWPVTEVKRKSAVPFHYNAWEDYTKCNLEGQSEKDSNKGIIQQDNICWRPISVKYDCVRPPEEQSRPYALDPW